MIDFREVVPSQYIDQAMGMAYAHWREVAKDTGYPPPELDIDQLPILERAGLAFAICPFDVNVMIGYSLVIIAPCFNFKGIRLAVNEGLYVMPEYRGITSLKLIRATEIAAKRRKANKMQWHAYAGTNAAQLFEKLGYNGNDVLFTKEL